MNIPDYTLPREPLLQRLGLTDPGGITERAINILATVFIATVIALCISGGFAVDNHSNHVSCTRLHEVTQLPTRYVRSGINGECYIQIDGQWIPENRWRMVDG